MHASNPCCRRRNNPVQRDYRGNARAAPAMPKPFSDTSQISDQRSPTSSRFQRRPTGQTALQCHRVRHKRCCSEIARLPPCGPSFARDGVRRPPPPVTNIYTILCRHREENVPSPFLKGNLPSSERKLPERQISNK